MGGEPVFPPLRDGQAIDEDARALFAIVLDRNALDDLVIEERPATLVDHVEQKSIDRVGARSGARVVEVLCLIVQAQDSPDVREAHDDRLDDHRF